MRTRIMDDAESSDLLEPHRSALFAHCYRMLGSPTEADDAVQETMVRAWKGLDRFEARAKLGTWLYRIATNVCLDALADRRRRERPVDLTPAGSVDGALKLRPPEEWLEPVPDARVVSDSADPGTQLMLRQSIRLAFVAALQHLPPKQRAALLSTEVLGMSAAETAECLDTSVASVNSAVQRARAKLATRDLEAPGPLSAPQRVLLDRYVEAFEKYDVDGLTALMRDDATMSMPPLELWLRGTEDIRAWMLGRGSECRGSRLVPTAANGQPAFGQYRWFGPEEGFRPWALVVLDLAGDSIGGVTSFLDVERLFPLFSLPAHPDR